MPLNTGSTVTTTTDLKGLKKWVINLTGASVYGKLKQFDYFGLALVHTRVEFGRFVHIAFKLKQLIYLSRIDFLIVPTSKKKQKQKKKHLDESSTPKVNSVVNIIINCTFIEGLRHGMSKYGRKVCNIENDCGVHM